MAKVIDETGNKYGRLLVIKRVGSNKRKHALWLCHCDCGNETTVPGVFLRDGNTKSCGCLRTLPKGQATFNRLYDTYKTDADKAGREFELTKEDFSFITKMNCHYCGAEPAQKRRGRGNNGDYIYNGVDRIDSTKGYVMDNVVACCWNCNRAKGTLSKEEFLVWVGRISAYQSKRYGKPNNR